MTSKRAEELREIWSMRPNPRECMHLNLELEWNHGKLPTTTYYCVVCGEPRYLVKDTPDT